MSASSFWVNSPVRAVDSTQWPRGVAPPASNAAVISVDSAWLAWASSQPRFPVSSPGSCGVLSTIAAMGQG